MSDEDESVVRAAYEAYGLGEVNRLLELVHPDLEWTYLDPSMENPQPQTCHGREQLAWALGQQADRSLVLTMGRGRIVALRDFRDRDEARGFAGLGQGKR